MKKIGVKNDNPEQELMKQPIEQLSQEENILGKKKDFVSNNIITYQKFLKDGKKSNKEESPGGIGYSIRLPNI